MTTLLVAHLVAVYRRAVAAGGEHEHISVSRHDVGDPVRDFVEEWTYSRLSPTLDGKHAVHEVREQAELHECSGGCKETESRCIPNMRERGKACGAAGGDRDARNGDLVWLNAAAV